MVYLMYERLQNEQSFYKPYLDMVDSPIPTCYWDDQVLELSDLKEFKLTLKEARRKCDIEWVKIKTLTDQFPSLFKSEEVTKELYLWALGFVQSRAFGWGMPCMMLVPMADCLNHCNDTYISADLVAPDLHKAMNQTYLYKHNFDKAVRKQYTEDDIYDKSSSRLQINCAKLFSEDEISQLPEEVKSEWPSVD